MPSQRTDWKARARRAESHLAALDAAVRGIAGVIDLDRVLQLIVDRVRDLAGARYAALGIAGPDGRLTAFLTSGISAQRRALIGPPPEGRGLLGLIIREDRSVRLTDLVTDPNSAGFPPHHPPMHAFLGVPIHVRGRSVGNLYLANKRRGGTFTADDQRLVEQFALHAGLAIETARLHEREARLAVIEERDRIGRDLHDGVIQRLYAVTLQLEDVPELVDEAPSEAQARVDRAIDAIQAAIGDIRDFIYGLGSEAAVNGEFGGDLELLADEVELASGIEVRVVGSDIRLPDGTRLELLTIVREALSNVVRHAQAMTATVTVRRTERGATITVADDGRGFTPGPGDPDHHGLTNMRSRALDLGGRLEVRSTPGEGTRIIASVPLDRAAEKGAP